MTFQEVLHVLETLKPTSLEGSYTLDRMHKLMDALGNPQEQLKVIHVAGTSGKTSTAYACSSLLEAQGKRVGLTVSPHIFSVTERLQVGTRPITESLFAEEFTELWEIVNKLSIKPTYFECLVALAYRFYALQSYDYVVVEVGLGGLLDGTNVVQREDKVCIITDIGFDHEHILGNTLEEIALQKAGIIQHRNQVFTHQQDENILNVLSEVAAGKDAPLSVVPESSLFDHNQSLAEAAVRYIAERDNWQIDESKLIPANCKVPPGRFHVIEKSGKTYVLDGAHNPQKLTYFMKLFKAKYPNQKAVVLLAKNPAKERFWDEFVSILEPIAEKIITFPVKDVKDYVESETAECDVPDIQTAFHQCGDANFVVVVGSLYAIADAVRSIESMA